MPAYPGCSGELSVTRSTDGSIDSKAEFNALSDGVTIVHDITFCGEMKVGVIGCASTPGKKMAAMPSSLAPRPTDNELDIDGVTLAHEYGDNK